MSNDKIAWDKLWIGSLMTISECITGGHYIEQLKIIKQTSGNSYFHITKNIYRNHGLFGLMYRSYFPYGMAQSITKGLPVLFVQHETSNYFHKNSNLSDNKISLLGGMLGGASQGLVVAPTQRLKTLIMTNPSKQGGSSFIMDTIKKEGMSTIFRGTHAMMLRRSIDWSIRFYGLSYVKNSLEEYSGEKKMWHSLLGGYIGGALSAFTLPIDVVIAKSQEAGSKGNPIAVTKELIKSGGYKAFSRGFLARVMHAGYHTMFVGGLGTIFYDWYTQKK